jgi:hypothetical protein
MYCVGGLCAGTCRPSALCVGIINDRMPEPASTLMFSSVRSYECFQMHPDERSRAERIGWTSWEPDDLDCNNVRPGDPVKRMGGEFIWTEDHLYGRDLEALRSHGDAPADAVVETLQLKPKDDALELIFPSTSGAGMASQNACIDDLKAHLLEVPSWVDWGKVRRGQVLFHRHGPVAGLALLNLSLAGGFSAPRINHVLTSTGYLSKTSKSYVRLVETLQMVNACMQPGGLKPHGVGWTASVRVRFLHAKVRRRLLQSTYYDEGVLGVPINQEDMGATLLSFQIVVLEVLEYVGHTITEQDRDDYTHLWRLIGHWSGVTEVNNPCKSYKVSRAYLESITMHLIDPKNNEVCTKMTKSILTSVVNKAPFYWSYETLAQLSRVFMGTQLADALNLPPENTSLRYFHYFNFALLRAQASLTYAPMVGPPLVALNNVFLEKWVDIMQKDKRANFALNHVPPLTKEEKATMEANVSKDNDAFHERVRQKLSYWESYLQMLKRDPITTKMWNSAVILGLGQVCGNKLAGKPLDKRRMLAFSAFGIFGMGPMVHYWLEWLRAHGPSNVLLRVAMDWLLFHPPFQFFFLASVGVLEGKGLRSVISETNAIFPAVIASALKFWPAVVFAIFKFIPPELHVLANNVAAFLWSGYLGVSIADY